MLQGSSRAYSVASVSAYAKSLLNQVLIHNLDGKVLSGRIVEVEAYHQTDPASHTFRGLSPANRSMFGPPGLAYVYFTYGSHFCFNVTAGPKGVGAGILIRALEPLSSIEQMVGHRFPKLSKELLAHHPLPTNILTNLCNGPGKLTQALAIDKTLDGHNLNKWPLKLQKGPLVPAIKIIATKRIGISQAQDEILRFYIKNNPFISRK